VSLSMEEATLAKIDKAKKRKIQVEQKLEEEVSLTWFIHLLAFLNAASQKSVELTPLS
jgi:hypothetical protein